MKAYRAKLSYFTGDESVKPQRFSLKDEVSPDPQDMAAESSPEEEVDSEDIFQDQTDSDSCPLSPKTPKPLDKPQREGEAALATSAPLKQSSPTNLPPTDLLVPLSEPVPNSWTTKEDDYFSICTFMVPILFFDDIGEQSLTVGSGKFRLQWVDGNITRKDAMNVVTQYTTFQHKEKDVGYWIDVKAFRIEPLTPDGLLLANERETNEPIQAQVHPGLARIMSRRRRK